MLIPELGLRGEIWGVQCLLRSVGLHGRYQRVYSGSVARPHLLGIDRFDSWEQFYGKSLDQRALVVTQSPLLALALYQAARKEIVVASIGSLPPLPIDPMILRLGAQMPVYLVHKNDVLGRDWFRSWKGARHNKRRDFTFKQLRSIVFP